MSPRNIELTDREPTHWERVKLTKAHVEDLDRRILNTQGAISDASQKAEAFLEMASEMEESKVAHERILAALEGERAQYADPSDYLAELFRLREAGE